MSTPTDYHIFKLDNGLRCVFRRAPHVGYCGIVVNAGSRDDGDEFGLAHFVEHTIFKGTEKRRSRHIASRMESVGGDLNAYTTKDETTVYTAFPAGFSPRALELLADLASASTFPADELDKERDVVVDEINLYLDNPSESIFDEFEDRIFAGSAPGHNILGTPESVAKIDSRRCLDFRRKFYTADNMTLFCVDDCSPQEAMANISRYFGALPSGERNNSRIQVAETTPFDDIIRQEGHQSHTILGARVSRRDDPERFALFMLNNHLGGPAMNSLLNRELRDKRGYVYTVESSINLMEDCGTMQIYFGCDPCHTAPCIRLTKKILTSLAESQMKPSVFEKVRRQYLGQLIVSTDNRESQAIGLAKSLMWFDAIHDAEFTASRVRELTAENVRAAAERILSAGLSRLTIDPTNPQ